MSTKRQHRKSLRGRGRIRAPKRQQRGPVDGSMGKAYIGVGESKTTTKFKMEGPVAVFAPTIAHKSNI